MTAKDEMTTPVTVRVGDHTEHVVGHLLADTQGRVRLEQLADLFQAVADHMRVIVDFDQRPQEDK